MHTSKFLAQLNHCEKGWGLWINRENLAENHVGQYAFENDRIPRNFVHAGSLDDLAHLRQTYIRQKSAANLFDDVLGQEWAEQFLSQWRLRAIT